MKFLNTGEFARMCGTQKGTLFYYDKEGLLKPKFVSDNGYRRYGAEQFYDFDMIAALKEAGSTLKEIKAHLGEKDKKKMLAFFEEKKRLLEKEKKELIRRQMMLDDIAASIREALAVAYDTLELVEMEAETLELVPVASEEQTTAARIVDMYVAFARRFETQGRYVLGSFGAMVPKENIMNSCYDIDYFFCRADTDTPKGSRHTKPRGRYAVLFHSGTIASHTKAYMNMLETVEGSGLTITGNMYTYDMASYFVTGGTDEYMAKYCLPVK